MPRMAALSEALWTPVDKKNFKDFVLRLNVETKRYDKLKINYAKHFIGKK
jgi:hexosaminidase